MYFQSRSTTPIGSPACHDYALLGGGPAYPGRGPAHLAAVSADVLQAFAGAGSTSLGVGTTGVGVGLTPHHRPSAGGVLAARPPSPPVSLGVSRDLLEATDFITGAVTSLVRELHSGSNDNCNWPIPGRPKPQLQLTSICMSRHAQPAPLCACAQPAHGPARLYVFQPFLGDECPPHAAQAAWHWQAVPRLCYMAITSVTNTFSVTLCR